MPAYQSLNQATAPGGYLANFLNKAVPISTPKPTANQTMGVQAKAPQVAPKTNTLPNNMSVASNSKGGYFGSLPKVQNPSSNLTPEQTANNAKIAQGGFKAQDVVGTPTTPSAPTTPSPAPTPAPQPQPTQAPTPAPAEQPKPTEFATYTGSLAGAPEQNKVYADRAREIANTAGQTISDIGQQGAKGIAGYRTTGTSPVAEGNAAVLAQTTAAQQQAVAQGAQMELAGNQQGLTAQSQGQTGLYGAAGLVKPESGATFFGSPLSGNVVGTGGVGNYTGNPLIDNSVSGAIETVRRGGSTTDAMNQLVGGSVAQQAFIREMQKIDPSWTPTSSNAIVQSNLEQSKKYQDQALSLDTTLKQIDNTTNVVTNFLNGAGLNNDRLPAVNEAVNKYINNVENPAAIRGGLLLYMNEIKNLQQKIVEAGGLTPTDSGYQIATTDPTHLNIKDLIPYIQNLRNVGQTRLEPIQNAAKLSSRGGGNLQTGTQAEANPAPAFAKDISGQDIVKSAQSGTLPKAAIGTIGSATANLLGGGAGLFDWLSKLGT